MLRLEVILPVVSVLGIYLFRMRELRARRETVRGTVIETRTLWLFKVVGFLLLLGGTAEFLLRGERLWWPTFVLGWACALASFAIRRQAIAALGRYWSLHVEIREDQPFVQSGPFRWVRHPTYASMVLELLAAGLILNAVLAVAGAATVFIPTLLRRIRLEEAALTAKFGEAYRGYCRTTPALFPRKWVSAK
jgi:protein-S-isoprenylcysteine O-methyltransferase Ste14